MGKPGIKERLKAIFGIKKNVSEELFEELEDILIEGDFGGSEAAAAVDQLRAICGKNRVFEADSIREELRALLSRMLIRAEEPALDEFTVILLLGVNGVGKTTSAAKLAHRYASLGHRPVLAAADTFRAAAIDQLKIHGERLGMRVIAHKHGGDPAAVVYDAIAAAQAGGGDLVIADTAGRMHTKTALVEELKKIDRVVEGSAGMAKTERPAGMRYLKWLVLDTTTGRNAYAQAEVFHEAVNLDGVVLTKYDSSARGGIAFSLSQSLKLPVLFVCDGEKYQDIHPFNADEYVREFTGIEK